MNKEKHKNIPELLSPAGSAKSVYAAAEAGADAVYIGGKGFNARMGAQNISDSEFEQIIDYCHLRGVMVYITVNTIYKESEFPELLKFVEKVYCYGADALIVSDIGAAMLFTEYFDIPIHASTQMAAHSTNDVLFLEDIGFVRTVLARELSIKEITEINSRINSEIEVFAHGALCVCYSGRCLMSSFIGGRSGNRGTCAQPCRKHYTLMLGNAPLKTGYLLSLKDLMSINILDKVSETGIAALKIEGRMKSPEYVYQVTSAYREQLDNMKNGIFGVSGKVLDDTAQVFNRGGFTEGYFEKHSAFSMISGKTPKSIGIRVGAVESYDDVLYKCKILAEKELHPGDGLEIYTKKSPHPGGGVSHHTFPGELVTININGDFDIQKGDEVYRTLDKHLNDNLSSLIGADTRKLKAQGYCRAKTGENFYVKITCDGLTAEAYGEKVQHALSRPVSEAQIMEQLSKTGATPFAVQYANNDISADIFIGIKQINSVRREALTALEKMIVKKYKRERTGINFKKRDNDIIQNANKVLSVSVYTNNQLNDAINLGKGKIARIYAEINSLSNLSQEYLNEISKKCTENNIEFFVALPAIQKDGIKSYIPVFEKTNIDGYLVRAFGQVYELDGCNSNKLIAVDYHFNIANSYSLEFFEDYVNAASIAISVELGFEDINSFAGKKTELIIYGKQILMATQQCPVGLYTANKPEGKFCSKKNNKDIYCLKDKTGVSFPVITDCDLCIAFILNDRPVYMANKMKDLIKTSASFLRLSFTDETEIGNIISVFFDALKNNSTDSGTKLETGLTYGRFYK